jgi:type VI secretion system protein ImpF
MRRIDDEARVTTSLLDRLLDYEPEASREPAASRSKSLRQLKQSVRRDLEWLLNTRQAPLDVDSEMREVNRSLAVYGLPDFSHLNIESASDQRQIRRLLEDKISIFEPRLTDVVLTIEPARGAERVIRFRIDARLKVDPAPEPVTFDTVLQLSSGQYIVNGE